MVSEKAIRTRYLFMAPRERDLISLSSLGPERTATRARTIKEAAAKALDSIYFRPSGRWRWSGLGGEEGVMRYQEKACPVRHSEGNGHVIALITCDDR
jgi:hypothetical protein